MELRYLLDTNICIYIRQKKPEKVSKHFEALRHGEAGISVITYGELIYGATKSKQSAAAFERLHELSELLPVVFLPDNAAEAYGRVRAELESRSELIGNNDLWIAAHALSAKLTLVTNNEKEFRRIGDLKIQNWAA
jgi:tRNA(fMet)-specific endonuclease VapC